MKKKNSLYGNIAAKRARVAKGKDTMRDKGDKGAPSEKDFSDAKKTAKKKK